MKILVIGANGFLGTRLVKTSLKKGWNVDCVYNKNKENIPKDCELFHTDELMKINRVYDAIFLLAAFIPYKKFNKPDKRFVETNIRLPLTVLKKFKNTKVIFSSSTSVYGVHKNKILEISSFNNPSLYGLSKLSAEFIIKHLTNHQIVRFSSLYGRGMSSETFIPKIIKQAREKKIITIFGEGTRQQDYLHINDAVGYLLAALEARTSDTYLGVSGSSYSNREVAKIVQSLIQGCEIRYTGEDNSPSFNYDNSKSKELLNFSPQTSLKDGLRRLIKNV